MSVDIHLTRGRTGDRFVLTLHEDGSSSLYDTRMDQRVSGIHDLSADAVTALREHISINGAESMAEGDIPPELRSAVDSRSRSYWNCIPKRVSRIPSSRSSRRRISRVPCLNLRRTKSRTLPSTSWASLDPRTTPMKTTATIWGERRESGWRRRSTDTLICPST